MTRTLAGDQAKEELVRAMYAETFSDLVKAEGLEKRGVPKHRRDAVGDE